MKFIGQYIQSFIARFRNDVYLEDIDTGTIASGSNLGLDSNNKIVKAASTSHDEVTLAGTPDYITILGQEITRNAIDLAADVTGTLPLANGGTGQTSAQAAINALAGGTTTGRFLRGNGSNVEMAAIQNSDIGTLNQDTTGSAATLTTPRAINGVDFDGSAPITVTAAAGTLSGTELKSTVVTSSLTSVGTIGTGVWQGTAIAQAYIAGDAINGDKIADDAVDSEHYTDGSIDTAHIADDQVTFAKASGVTPNVYGSIIKVLPSDFMANEEPGVTKTLQFVDNDASGIKPGDNNTELLAFVSIPEGMKATHVDVYADANLVFSVYEFNIHESVGDISAASKGTGACNTTLDITDVNATATNYLLIQVVTVSKADRVWGAKVTIAAQ